MKILVINYCLESSIMDAYEWCLIWAKEDFLAVQVSGSESGWSLQRQLPINPPLGCRPPHIGEASQRRRSVLYSLNGAPENLRESSRPAPWRVLSNQRSILFDRSVPEMHALLLLVDGLWRGAGVQLLPCPCRAVAAVGGARRQSPGELWGGGGGGGSRGCWGGDYQVSEALDFLWDLECFRSFLC